MEKAREDPPVENGHLKPAGEEGDEAARKEEAESLKAEGNRLYKEKHHQLSIDKYTEAIELWPHSAVYFANRAAAQVQLEFYGAGLADATRAIELDPAYVKGYYRRADSNLGLGKVKAALSDFRRAAKVAPRDVELRKKLEQCEKAVKRLRFEEAVAVPDEKPPSEQLDLRSIEVDEGYTGPRMAGSQEEGYRLTREFMVATMEAFKQQKSIHKRFAYEIILQALALIRREPTLVDISIEPDAEFTVCGDIHGQFYDLLKIFDLNGLPSETNPYLFNGDFVDRGAFQVEVILTLLGWRALLPGRFHLARGNHESKGMNKTYGFCSEVASKFTSLMADLFGELFCWLPLAHCLNGRVLVLHGGLFSRDGVTLDDLRAIPRGREPPDEGLMCEALWSDPQPEKGRGPSKRGIGVSFGPDVTKAFLKANGLDLLVRSHEVKEKGYEVDHDGRCITVFSAANYCDGMGNLGAFIRFRGGPMKPHFTTFAAAPHPNVPNRAAANPFSIFGMQ